MPWCPLIALALLPAAPVPRETPAQAALRRLAEQERAAAYELLAGVPPPPEPAVPAADRPRTIPSWVLESNGAAGSRTVAARAALDAELRLAADPAARSAAWERFRDHFREQEPLFARRVNAGYDADLVYRGVRLRRLNADLALAADPDARRQLLREKRDAALALMRATVPLRPGMPDLAVLRAEYADERLAAELELRDGNDEAALRKEHLIHWLDAERAVRALVEVDRVARAIHEAKGAGRFFFERQAFAATLLAPVEVRRIDAELWLTAGPAERDRLRRQKRAAAEGWFEWVGQRRPPEDHPELARWVLAEFCGPWRRMLEAELSARGDTAGRAAVCRKYLAAARAAEDWWSKRPADAHREVALRLKLLRLESEMRYVEIAGREP